MPSWSRGRPKQGQTVLVDRAAAFGRERIVAHAVGIQAVDKANSRPTSAARSGSSCVLFVDPRTASRSRP